MSNKLLSRVLCHHILIQKRGQRVCFQIIVPRDVVRIVGIETSIRSRYCRAFMPWQRDFTAGLLTLQSAGSADVCYSSYVMVEQKTRLPTDLGNTGYGYFNAGFYDWTGLAVDGIAQSGYREPDILNIAAPRLLSGTYSDQWGPALARNLTYRLSVHLWVTINDLYNTPCHE